MTVTEYERVTSTYSRFAMLADLEREVESAFEGVKPTFEAPVVLDPTPDWVQIDPSVGIGNVSVAVGPNVEHYLATTMLIAPPPHWPQYSYTISVTNYSLISSVAALGGLVTSSAAHSVIASTGAEALVIPSGVRSRAEYAHGPDNFARECLDDLASWLGVSLSELASALGLGRSTIYSWAERGSTPRPAKTRLLYRVHAIVALAVRTVGTRNARVWLQSGKKSPKERILSGAQDQIALDHLAAEVQELFAPAHTPPVDPWLTVNISDNPADLPNAVPEGW